MQNSSYFIENRALFGSFPKQQHVDELVDRGVRYFVDLTQSDEARIVPYQVPNQCQKIKFPIRDHNVPRDWYTFSRFICRISQLIQNMPNGHKMYVHCRGGHGRAGMVVSILLGHICRLEPIDAMKKTSIFHSKRPSIKEKWKAIGSPHEYRQRAFVYRFFEPLTLHRIQYKSEYDNGFSRFSQHPILVNGKRYECVEGALLSQMVEKYAVKTNVDFSVLTGKDAFLWRKNRWDIISRNLKCKEWEDSRRDVLHKLIMVKLKQHPEIKQKLLRSGLRKITMVARGNFTWPGGQGMNVTGTVLMKIRHELYLAPMQSQTENDL